MDIQTVCKTFATSKTPHTWLHNKTSSPQWSSSESTKVILWSCDTSQSTIGYAWQSCFTSQSSRKEWWFQWQCIKTEHSVKTVSKYVKTKWFSQFIIWQKWRFKWSTFNIWWKTLSLNCVRKIKCSLL